MASDGRNRPGKGDAKTLAPKFRLDTPATYLKGVGPSRATALRKLGVITAGDLLFHIPHRYEDASTVSPISSLAPGMNGTVIGRVISKGVIPTRKGLRVFQAVLKERGIPSTVRQRRGIDVAAGCGQLVASVRNE